MATKDQLVGKKHNQSLGHLREQESLTLGQNSYLDLSEARSTSLNRSSLGFNYIPILTMTLMKYSIYITYVAIVYNKFYLYTVCNANYIYTYQVVKVCSIFRMQLTSCRGL